MTERRGRIGLSEEQAELLESAGKYCRDKSPMARVRELIDDEVGHDPVVWAEMAELGWLGIAIDEADGGAGLELAEVVPVVEMMGRTLMAGPFVSTTLAAQLVAVGGRPDQKRALLPRLAAGEPATLACAEPAVGWALHAPGCRAERAGGALRLSGTKHFVLDAHVAQHVFATVLLEGAPALVYLDAEALATCTRRRETVIDETRRSFALGLDGVRLPSSALLDGGDVGPALERLSLAGALLSAAEMVGAGVSCIESTIERLNTRRQFGRPIGAYQALKHTTVDAHVRIEQARSHLYGAAHVFEQAEQGEIAVRMAKAAAGPALAFAADRSIQFHGGYGFTYECDAHLYRRRAVWGESQWGDAMEQRRRLAALIL